MTTQEHPLSRPLLHSRQNLARFRANTELLARLRRRIPAHSLPTYPVSWANENGVYIRAYPDGAHLLIGAIQAILLHPPTLAPRINDIEAKWALTHPDATLTVYWTP